MFQRLMAINHETRQRVAVGILIGLAIVVSFFVYEKGLSGGLLFDDYPQLGHLLEVSPDDSLDKLKDKLVSHSGPLKRPVSMATFLTNALMHGDNIWYWKLTNLLIHVLTFVVIFGFSLILFNRAYPQKQIRNYWLALLVGAVWLLHPLHVSTVLYTVQRMTQLAALFVLLALMLFAIGRRKQIIGERYGAVFMAAAYVVFFPLAIFSKETALLFPLFVLVLELVVFKFDGYSEKSRFKKVYLSILVFPLLLIMVAFYFDFKNILSGYEVRDFTLTERLLSQPRVVILYLQQLTFPMQKTMGFFHDDLIYSKNLIHPITTLFSLIAILALISVAWFVRNKMPLVTFGISFFFIGHLLESTIFPLEMMYEHRNYLPSVGVVIAMVGAIPAVVSKPRTLSLIGLSWMVLLSFVTLMRVDTWSDENKMYTYMYSVHPNSKRLNVIVANAYADAKQYDTAESILKKLDVPAAKLNLAYIYCIKDGRVEDELIQDIKSAIPKYIDDYYLSGVVNLSRAGIEGKCEFTLGVYLSLLHEVLQKRFKSVMERQIAMMYQAHYLYKIGRFESAIQALEKAFVTYSKNVVPLFLATEWALEQGKIDIAQDIFARAKMAADQSGKNYEAYINKIGAKINELNQ